jgi:hypothetical protein
MAGAKLAAAVAIANARASSAHAFSLSLGRVAKSIFKIVAERSSMSFSDPLSALHTALAPLRDQPVGGDTETLKSATYRTLETATIKHLRESSLLNQGLHVIGMGLLHLDPRQPSKKK